jgi:hypothetical protein
LPFHQHSLEYSSLAAPCMEKAVHEACVGTIRAFLQSFNVAMRYAVLHWWVEFVAGVIVLSKEFVTREWPMKELIWFLARYKKDQQSVSLLPVFLRLTCDNCSDLERLYDTDAFWEGIPSSHKAHVFENKVAYVQAVKDLLSFTGVHTNTVGTV